MEITWDGDRAVFAKAFVAAQRATEAVKKASTNPAFKSKYADLASVVEAVVPALNAHGIGVLQFPAFDGDFTTVTTTLLHESGASVTATLALRPSKLDSQGIGSAVTYARRYSLLAMAGAASEDDDGNAASGPVVRSWPAPTPDSGMKRLSSARAKEIGLDKEIKNAIDGCTSGEELADWNREFDKHTAQCPLSWLDSIRNSIILRAEEIARENGEDRTADALAEFDRAFAGTVGP